jgi:hypothetical protein
MTGTPAPASSTGTPTGTAIDPRAIHAALDRLVGEVEAYGTKLAEGFPVNCSGLDAKVAVLCQVAERMAVQDAAPIVARLVKLVAALEALGERLNRTGAMETKIGARAVAGAYAARSS